MSDNKQPRSRVIWSETVTPEFRHMLGFREYVETRASSVQTVVIVIAIAETDCRRIEFVMVSEKPAKKSSQRVTSYFMRYLSTKEGDALTSDDIAKVRLFMATSQVDEFVNDSLLRLIGY